MSSLLMKTDDSDDENESFRTKMCIKIRKFLRLKDIHKVRDTMRYNDRLMCDKHVCKRKQQRSCKDYNNNQSDSEMSVVYAFDTEDESGDEIDKLIKKQNGEPFEVNKFTLAKQQQCIHNIFIKLFFFRICQVVHSLDRNIYKFRKAQVNRRNILKSRIFYISDSITY